MARERDVAHVRGRAAERAPAALGAADVAEGPERRLALVVAAAAVGVVVGRRGVVDLEDDAQHVFGDAALLKQRAAARGLRKRSGAGGWGEPQTDDQTKHAFGRIHRR